MKTADFFFDLPETSIAQFPAPRGESRLMTLCRETGRREHRMVQDLPEILAAPEFSRAGPPLLVFNNSRVRKARLKGISLESGAEAEFILLNRINDETGNLAGKPAGSGRTWRTLAKRAKRRKLGSRYRFGGVSGGGIEGEIVPGGEGLNCASSGEQEAPFRFLRFDSPVDDDWLDIHGHVPLPPYISRDDEAADAARYQTVYAGGFASQGFGPGASAAAPTAGLHFTGELLDRLQSAGIESVFITLHVGLGTFLPVRTENIEDHVMHEEMYSIDEDAARRINAAHAAGRKIIAVGTTGIRTLESAWTETGVQSGEGVTSIFIYPGYRFKTASALFTNFHTPGSTLLMLVSAFAGNRELILESYGEAIREGCRFFSYGDAMLIW